MTLAELTTELARMRAECERLKDDNSVTHGMLLQARRHTASAERERDEARKAHKRYVEDTCDADDQVRTQAKRVLPEDAVDGDSYNVPSLAEIAEMLADEVVRARAAMGGT